jgi:hypothetical protein
MSAGKVQGISSCSFFAVGVDDQPLRNSDSVSNMIQRLQDMKVVIIDVISFINQAHFASIHRQVKLAKGNDRFFGGIFVIMTVDMNQLKCVGGRPLYYVAGFETTGNLSSSQSNRKKPRIDQAVRRLLWTDVKTVFLLNNSHRCGE